MKCVWMKVRDSRIARIRNGFNSVRTDQLLLSDAWIPGEGDLKDIDKNLEKLPEMQKSLDDENNQNTKFDVEKNRAVKTVDSNEVKSKALSTVNEEENDSRSKRSKKIPTRYLNYELHVNWSFAVHLEHSSIAYDDHYLVHKWIISQPIWSCE